MATRRFMTTRWSVVLTAADRTAPDYDEAMAYLCRNYWYPLYAYVRRRGNSAHETEELTQEFFSRLIEKEFIRDTNPEKGRFRAFLLVCLKRFLANEWDRARAEKRGGKKSIFSIDFRDADERYRREPVHGLTPERIFERRWALLLLEQALYERRLKVTDNEGKPAVHDAPHDKPGRAKFEDVQLEIVWTSPSQHGWNYSIPELHGGKDWRQSEYPSAFRFLERKLGAKTFLEVSIPDTPYSFYIINGHVSPYFYDVKKDVIWRLKSVELEKEFRYMVSISASSKSIVFSPLTGDCAIFLVVDFSDRENSPNVKYWIRYDGP